VTFEVTVAASATEGEIAEFALNLTDAEGYEKSLSMSLTIGLTKEDFESGDFSSFGWEHSGNAVWTIVGDAYEGSYAAKSGNISDSQNSGLSITGNVLSAGQISFAVKVSCENDSANNYDKLIFFIDGVEQDRWDGETTWTVVDYNVAAGEHTFLWKYVKDGAVSDGSDCGWIDNIIFPSINFASGSMINISVNAIDFDEVSVNEEVTSTFTITNTGSTELSGTFNLPQDVTIEPANVSISAGQYQGYVVTFTPQTEGSYNEVIEVNTNAGNNESVEIAVTAEVVTVSNDNVITYEDKVYGNYPNPFNPTTSVKFSVKADNTPVEVKIYNIKGELVKTVLKENVNTGLHDVKWHGKDSSNKQVGSGVYFYSVKIAEKKTLNKMLMLK
jgi:hypothetical protein